MRKPGAFAHYRYRADLFPSSHFRLAYDHLRMHQALRADKEYLAILHLAARESEQRVEDALRLLLAGDEAITSQAVAALVACGQQPAPLTDVAVQAVDLRAYDGLLERAEALTLTTLAPECLAPEVA